MIAKEKTIRGKILGLLVSGIFIVLGFYIYFMGSMVFEIVDRKGNARDFQKISAEYQQLEEKYFNLSGEFNLEYAKSLGFVSQTQNDVVIRQTAVARLD